MKYHSLESIIGRLSENLSDLSDIDQFSKDKVVSSIRIDKSAHEFFSNSAEMIGMSYNALINNTLLGVMKATLKTEASLELDLMIERFFQIFRSHGIPYAYIPEVLKPFRIKLSDIETSRESLLDLLTEDLRSWLAETFHINKGWIDGVSPTLYQNPPNWWDNLESFARILWREKNKGNDVQVLYAREETSTKAKPLPSSHNVGVIIQSTSRASTTYNTYIFGSFRDCTEKSHQTLLKVLMQFCHKGGVSQSELLLDDIIFREFLLASRIAADVVKHGVRNAITIPWIEKNLLEDKDLQQTYEGLSLELLEKIVEYPGLVKNPKEFGGGNPLEVIK